MVDAIRIQSHIYKGYGKAAERLGLPFSIKRPTSTTDPLENEVGVVKVSLNAEDFRYGKPNKYGKPTWYAVMDGTTSRVGDYLVGADLAGRPQIFFIATQQPLLPILVVECNGSIRISRTTASVGEVGPTSYSGVCDDSGDAEDVIGKADGEGWPASLIFGTGRLKNDSAMPAGTFEQLVWQIRLPASIPDDIVITPGDILTDDLNRKFVTNGAEKTALGWRVNATEVHK